jgi:uncharacterized protein YbaA (DUF1428 family)
MKTYIDGFTLPIPRKHLEEYKQVAQKIAEIWKEHGALSYQEFVGDDLSLEGVASFPDFLNTQDDEVIIFGWVVFESKEARNLAHKNVAADSRMVDLVSPLTDPTRMIFNPQRMVYGGFEALMG